MNRKKFELDPEERDIFLREMGMGCDDTPNTPSPAQTQNPDDFFHNEFFYSALSELAQKKHEIDDDKEKRAQRRHKGIVDGVLDLHGFKRGAALVRLDEFIGGNWLRKRHRLRVIHGKGSGVLRDAVREFLQHDDRVQSCQQAPIRLGGSGALIVTLKTYLK